MPDKLVYDFAEGSKDMRELLGGKGANVAEMTRVLGKERVPAGFTITTEACVEYMKGGGLPSDEIAAALERLQEARRLCEWELPMIATALALLLTAASSGPIVIRVEITIGRASATISR